MTYPLNRPSPPAGPLAGRRIVVTRPGFQAALFSERLMALGAVPLVVPTIVILPPADRAALAEVHARFAGFDFAIFVSANAVEFGVPSGVAWPKGVRAVAPGPGTAEVLTSRGVPDVLLPVVSFDSEGILALPEMSEVAGRRIVILRGNGGRELLATELAARGAHVETVECYRRMRPESGVDGLLEAWKEGRVDAITITSSEGLANLWAMVGPRGRDHLVASELFAPHRRIADEARRLGCVHVHETAATDAGLIAGLLARFAPKP